MDWHDLGRALSVGWEKVHSAYMVPLCTASRETGCMLTSRGSGEWFEVDKDALLRMREVTAELQSGQPASSSDTGHAGTGSDEEDTRASSEESDESDHGDMWRQMEPEGGRGHSDFGRGVPWFDND